MKWAILGGEMERQEEQRRRRHGKVNGLDDDHHPHRLDRERLIDLLEEALPSALELYCRVLMRMFAGILTSLRRRGMFVMLLRRLCRAVGDEPHDAAERTR